MNTIRALPLGNNVYLFKSDTIRLVQNRCSFHGLRSEDPNQHLKDFLKLVDSLDVDGENRERTRLHLFQFFLRDQASNWLERLPARSITIWEDLTTRYLAQFFPPRRTAKLRNDILMFQQHQGESLSEAWTHFKDLLQKVPHHGIDLWLKVLLEDLSLHDNESWNYPRDFAKPVKVISLPQDVLGTSDRYLIELENQFQCLMEAHLDLTQSNLEGLVSNYMASQDVRLSKFEADFKQQQSKMTNKIDTVLKAITDRMAGALPSDTWQSSQKLGKNGSAFVQGRVSAKMEDSRLYTLPWFYLMRKKLDKFFRKFHWTIPWRFLALGWHLEEIHVTWAHLEKKRTRLRLYTKNHEELCKQRVETESPSQSDGVRIFIIVTASKIQHWCHDMADLKMN
ncbi:MAK10-like protein [Tanacetum coccineum]